MVTVLDVAQHAGVSSATVSRVLSGRDPVAVETRTRVLQAVAALGYRPNYMAQSLRLGRGRSVALLTGDIEQGIYSSLTKHIQAALEAIGLDLLLFNLSHREDRMRHLLQHATSLGLRGILIAAPHVIAMRRLQPHIAALADQGIPIISVGQRLDRHGIASVVPDDAEGAATAVRHLLARGQAPLAFLGRIKDSAIGRERYRGYRQALDEHGMAVSAELVWEAGERYRSEAGYASTAAALARGIRARGVLAASDELALGGMAAAHDHGLKVPGDIAFIGFGGLQWTQHVRPSLSSVSLDLPAIGVAVADMFQGLDQGRALAPLTVIPSRFVARQSG